MDKPKLFEVKKLLRRSHPGLTGLTARWVKMPKFLEKGEWYWSAVVEVGAEGWRTKKFTVLVSDRRIRLEDCNA